MDFTEQNLGLLRKLPLSCPQCQGTLIFAPDAFRCHTCGKGYPVVAGIPDFRLFRDPFLGFQDDYIRTRLVLDHADKLSFKDLLVFYWSNSPETPDAFRKRFVRTALLAELKGYTILSNVETSAGHSSGREKVLEIGSGTGGFLVPAATKFAEVVGIDIALRWLAVARKRLEESGTQVPLLCCCAEYLPFPDGYFDLVVASATLEHTRDQSKVIAESSRVLKKDGELVITTPNRYSLAAEPHVHLWGVGFLPRSWMAGYVRLLKGVDYKHHRLLSYYELRELLGSFFRRVRFMLPDVDDAILKDFGRWKRLQVRIYRRLRAVAAFQRLLLWCGPMYYISCAKE